MKTKTLFGIFAIIISVLIILITISLHVSKAHGLHPNLTFYYTGILPVMICIIVWILFCRSKL